MALFGGATEGRVGQHVLFINPGARTEGQHLPAACVSCGRGNKASPAVKEHRGPLQGVP